MAIPAAIVLGTLSLAHAGCTFQTGPLADGVAPRTDVTLVATCLHDEAGNALAGKTVTLTVTRPMGGSDTLSATTDDAGNTSVTYPNTHELGTYAISAVSGVAHASATLTVTSGDADGSFDAAPSPGCVASSATPTVDITATGIRDANGDPAFAPYATFTFTAPDEQTTPDGNVVLQAATTFSRRVDITAPATALDTDITSVATTFDFKLDADSGNLSAGDVYAPAGSWTVEVTEGSASATTTFQVLDTIPTSDAQDVTLAGPDSTVEAGSPAAITATVKNAAGDVQPCADVTFDVTGPSGSSSVTRVTDADGVAAFADVNNDAYGEYTVGATSGSASATPIKYTAGAGGAASFVAVANPSVGLTGNSIVVEADRVVDGSNRPVSSTAPVNLMVHAPDGTRFRASPAVLPASTRTGRASASDMLSASDVNQTGDWLLQAYLGETIYDSVNDLGVVNLDDVADLLGDSGKAIKALDDPNQDWNVDALGLFITAISSTHFIVVDSFPAESSGDAVRDLTIDTTDAQAASDPVTVTISDIPDGSDLASIHVTPPSGPAYDASTSSIAGNAATITLSGAQTAAGGLYSLTAATSEGGVTNGTGDATFAVASAGPLDTVIDQHPQTHDNSDTATFTFHAVGGPASTFKCTIDDAPEADCASPASFGGLADGDHSFSVRAVAGGDSDATPATFEWTIDAMAPVVVIDGPTAQVLATTRIQNSPLVGHVTDDVAGIGSVTIEYRTARNEVFTTDARLECADGGRLNCAWQSFDAPRPGTYAVTAIAHDRFGGVGRSTPLEVTVTRAG